MKLALALLVLMLALPASTSADVRGWLPESCVQHGLRAYLIKNFTQSDKIGWNQNIYVRLPAGRYFLRGLSVNGDTADTQSFMAVLCGTPK